VSVKYLSEKLKVATRARAPSITMDFSWVTANAGLLHWTGTLACSKALKLSSLARLPDDRWGFSITRTARPRRCASISAWTRCGSSSVNCLTSIDRVAAATRLTTACTVSSGSTISVRRWFLLNGIAPGVRLSPWCRDDPSRIPEKRRTRIASAESPGGRVPAAGADGDRQDAHGGGAGRDPPRQQQHANTRLDDRSFGISVTPEAREFMVKATQAVGAPPAS